jgi:thioredoxin-related protein
VRTSTRVAIVLTLLGLATAASAAPAGEGIVWHDYGEGLALARQTGKSVFIHFTADWCKWCQKMKKETYTDPEVVTYVRDHFVAVMVDTQRERGIAADYYVRGLPTIWFLTSEGERIASQPGYIENDMFLKILRFIATDSYKTMGFDAFLEAGPPRGGEDAAG